MGKREELIALSIKYEGEYFKIVEAIKKQEPINGVSLENCITIFDSKYPKRFFDLKYPPLVLYYKGDISLLNDEEIIGIVGTRKPCDYSLKAVEYVIDKNKDSIYVSGLAHGIDAKVHDYSNKSIGVLGCGNRTDCMRCIDNF